MIARNPSANRDATLAHRRGLTLLEVLVYLSIWALLSIATIRALGEARLVRSGADDRATMTAMAQEILDEARLRHPLPDTETEEQISLTHRLSGTEATLTGSEGPSGTVVLEVVVRRESIEGKPTVTLTTLLPGGPQ